MPSPLDLPSPRPQAERGPRLEPAQPPFPAEVQALLDRIMPPGVPPLSLFTTLARDPRLFQRFMSAGLLDRGNLTLRQREVIIGRVTAQCGSEYEWGVHVALFGQRVGLTTAQQHSLVHGEPEDPCWDDADGALLRLCDDLHQRCQIDDGTWSTAREWLGDNGLTEALMLAGFYRMVAYLTNGLRLPLEPFAARFPARDVSAR
jgi:alkylhydroperoxidase family enzyme